MTVVPLVQRVPAVATFVVAFTAALVTPGAAASPPLQLGSPGHPTSAPNAETRLDVPYVPQSGVLCGGAALSMVLRYWGESLVYAEDFLSLVGQDSLGIPTDVLASAAERRGYRTARLAETRMDLAGNVARRWPTIVLLADGSERYHYVVVVGLAPGQVVVHDPADRPFRPIAEETFQRRWAASGHWSLLVLPNAERHQTAAEDAGNAATPAPAHDVCAADAKKAVRIATTDLARAESLLLKAAAERCRLSPSTWRELAGVRFIQQRWSEAAEFAETATALDPLDDYAWRLLATSRFLEDDLDTALAAWNRIDEPRVDLARIDGLSRTRYRVVADQLSLEPGHLLTHERLRVADRRISELPSVSSTRVGFHPTTDQRAIMDVTVVEKPLVYPNVLAAIRGSGTMVDRGMLVGSAFQAFFNREVAATVTSLMGRGEKLTASWRWWDMRPRIALALAVPRLFRLPGIATLDGSWERQTYSGNVEADSPVIEERRHAGLSLADWFHSDLRWSLGAGIDRWQDRGAFTATSAGLERRIASDRIALRGSAGWWTGLSGQGSFGTASVDAAWRQSPERPGWSARAGVRVADTTAPRDLWPGAGTGQGRAVLLRAHPILDSGVLGGAGFGPALAYGGLEHQQELRKIGRARLDWVAFSDVVRVWNRPAAADGSFLIDVGVGLRIALPGTGGALKVDVAHGLRDGAFAGSAGWTVPWPAFQP